MAPHRQKKSTRQHEEAHRIERSRSESTTSTLGRSSSAAISTFSASTSTSATTATASSSVSSGSRSRTKSNLASTPVTPSVSATSTTSTPTRSSRTLGFSTPASVSTYAPTSVASTSKSTSTTAASTPASGSIATRKTARTVTVSNSRAASICSTAVSTTSSVSPTKRSVKSKSKASTTTSTSSHLTPTRGNIHANASASGSASPEKPPLQAVASGSGSGTGTRKSRGKNKKKPYDPYDKIWQPSDSPEETFSDAEGANEDGEWPVQIVGEEVDLFGRVKYEASWGNWHRKDAHKTSNTWDNDLLPDNMKEKWDKEQSARRKALAAESMDIPIWCSIDVHQTETWERWYAAKEKWERRQRVGRLELTKRAEELMRKRMTEEERLEWEESLAEKEGEAEEEGSRSGASVGTSVVVPLRQSARARAKGKGKERVQEREAPPVIDRKGKRKARQVILSDQDEEDEVEQEQDTQVQMEVDDGDVSGWEEHDMDVEMDNAEEDENQEEVVVTSPNRLRSRRLEIISPSVSTMDVDVDVGSTRSELISEWNAIAQSTGAAEITIVNEVDDEAIPPIPDGFIYVESGYIYPPEIKPPDLIDELFLRCEGASCKDASHCECQDLLSVMDSIRRKIYAYDENGLYNFEWPQGFTVVECNKFCKCPVNRCRNRVAQRPRDIPIQVFKTLGCGWGVCSPVYIKKGKVLGMYAGTILTRKQAELLDEEVKLYCFDLDGQEAAHEVGSENSFSVDSRECGNWTRFLNHSCSPNLHAYEVVYDSIPEMNRPYIAFAALRPIQPFEELTIDYDPGGAMQFEVTGKKFKSPPGAKPCRCGSQKCRGWVKSIS